jgi:nitroimidazol reductase NimA-like FMN-containing flavoprotein (pyridoxamine 5'-phosphate oxidase superfamily)
MRRKELAGNIEEFDAITGASEVGYLGIIDAEGWPRVVPVNFVAVEGVVYFHGAKAGEKYTLFRAGPRVTFSVDVPYSIIPSYWFDDADGCNVSAFYKSVHIRGRGSLVEDVEEKAGALQRMMEKYQPEGGYAPITDVALYEKDLRRTAVFRIDPEQISMKVKFGQNLRRKVRERLIAKLEERAEGMDIVTAEEIRKTL